MNKYPPSKGGSRGGNGEISPINLVVSTIKRSKLAQKKWENICQSVSEFGYTKFKKISPPKKFVWIRPCIGISLSGTTLKKKKKQVSKFLGAISSVPTEIYN